MQIIIVPTAVQKWKARIKKHEREICNVEEKVRYWVEVSEYDYNEYKIGNYYKLYKLKIEYA